MARWNDGNLVTAEGLVFHPREGTVPAGLPTLEGEDRRAPEVVGRYLQWRDELMLVGHLIQTLGVDARGSWSLDLVSGVRLELGTEHIDQRLQRFMANVAQLEAAGQPKIVDLRYSNGFSVTWRRSAPTLPAQAPEDQTAKVPAKPRSALAKTKAPRTQATTPKGSGTKTKRGTKTTTATKPKAPTTKTATSKPPAAAQTKTDRTLRSANGG